MGRPDDEDCQGPGTQQHPGDESKPAKRAAVPRRPTPDARGQPDDDRGGSCDRSDANEADGEGSRRPDSASVEGEAPLRQQGGKQPQQNDSWRAAGTVEGATDAATQDRRRADTEPHDPAILALTDSRFLAAGSWQRRERGPEGDEAGRKPVAETEGDTPHGVLRTRSLSTS
jgi:hypothetical protein